MIKITILILASLVLTGCSQNNFYASENTETNSISGEYINYDGFGNSINIILNQDGSYESQLIGIIGLKGYSTGNWKRNPEMKQVSFMPAVENGILTGYLKPMTVLYENKNISLIPTKKIKNHYKQMADFGKSTYSYSRNSI